jgi:peptidoglycan hydrolase CwlO-like protein
MKTLKTYVFFALIIMGGALNAQKPISVTDDSVSFEAGKYPGVVVTIPEFNFERAQKHWIKDLQDGTKSKVVNESGEMTIFGASLKKVSPNPVNIYSKFINRDTILLLTVAVELGKDKYVERANGENELTEVKVYMRQFAKDEYVDAVKDELSEKNKALKDLQNDLESLQNKNLKIHKSIESNKTDISEAEINIKMLNAEADKITAELIEQKGNLSSMEPGVAKDQKEDYIKDTEKRKKKIVNDVESSRNKITSLTSEIDRFEDDIVKNESDQQIMKDKVTKQEAVVQQCSDKLDIVEAF